jgi:hypothetical protein
VGAAHFASLHRTGTLDGMDANDPALDPTAPSASSAPKARDDVASPLRVPIAAAAERGVSWLAATAAGRRVVLTRFGRPTAVVDSAERLDESARQVRAARREVLAHVADAAADRLGSGRRTTLEGACARLGLDVAQVRARARELAD